MRLSDGWASATRLPATIEATARPKITGRQSSTAPGNASNRSRISAANAAALTPVAMKAVTGVGEPS